MDLRRIELRTGQCPDNSGGPIWTRGESDPRLRNANAAFYHLTTGPPELSWIRDL